MQNATKFYEALSVTGPWGAAIVSPVSLHLGLAPAYNALSLVLFDSALAPDFLLDQPVTATLSAGGTTQTLFCGYVRTARRVLAADEDALYCECDGAESSADFDVCNAPRATDASALGWRGVFNEDGRPNKHPTLDAFYWGADATYWTGADALRYIRDNWSANATWALTDVQIAAVAGLAAELRPYDARGVPVLRAVAEIARRCGARLAFAYATGAAVPVLFDAAGAGTFAAHWRDPLAPADPAAPADDLEVYRLSLDVDGRGRTPVLWSVGGRYLHECTYSSQGTAPLLAAAASRDADYKYEYTVAVANYGSHYAGAALAAGSRPWPLRHVLATRRAASAGAYHTASEVTANPAIGDTLDVRETLAYLDGSTWRRIVNGARFYPEPDNSGVVLRLKEEITVQATASTVRIFKLTSAPTVRFTAAAEIPTVIAVRKDTYAANVTTDRAAVANVERLAPSRRYNATLPGVAVNTWTTVEAAAAAVYLDTTDRLRDAIAGPYEQRSRAARRLQLLLPFLSREVPLGARLELANAPAAAPLSGRELVVDVAWSLEDVEPTVTCCDALDVFEDADEPAAVRRAVAAIRLAAKRREARRPAA